MEYLRDPQGIYRLSFEMIRDAVDLSPFPPELHPAVLRIVHACGDETVAERVRWSGLVVEAVREAVAQGGPIFCDSEMVAHGIIRRHLGDCEVICTLNDPQASSLAKEQGTTRSAAAVELWTQRLEGAVVVIGNAPTALFHLLEKLEKGGPKPAAILGCPVGFVGAAESKDALIEQSFGVPFITVTGRRGGSAIAAAAVNALTLPDPERL